MGLMTIYEGPNADVASKDINYDDKNLWGDYWQDKISSIWVKDGEVIVYEHADYTGHALHLKEGYYPGSTLGAYGMDNAISSWDFIA